MLGIAVCLGINNDPVEPQIPATVHDADGYFAAVGDENLSFHTIPLVKKRICVCKAEWNIRFSRSDKRRSIFLI
jgi:hypothetical protein